MGKHDDAERRQFTSRTEWRRWLSKHHDDSTGLFVIYFKKGARQPGPTYDDLIEEALCFGWVDGTLRTVDEQRTSLWFSPRRAGSTWAATNKERVVRLREAGLMTPAGEAAVARAQENGSWSSLDRAEALEPPDELAVALAGRAGAEAAFAALSPGARKQFIHQVDSAKRPETRRRRAELIVESLGLS